jgi:hypothetical protein
MGQRIAFAGSLTREQIEAEYSKHLQHCGFGPAAIRRRKNFLAFGNGAIGPNEIAVPANPGTICRY